VKVLDRARSDTDVSHSRSPASGVSGKLGIRGTLLALSFGLVAITALAVGPYLTRSFDRLLVERTRDDLLARAALIADDPRAAALPPDDRSAWDRFADERARAARARVTLIAGDGAVLGDSEVAAADLPRLESHADRPEVIDARARGSGASVRWSATQRRRMIYVALPLGADGIVVRVALTLDGIDRAVSRLRRALAVAALAALTLATLLSLGAAHLWSRRLGLLIGAARRMAEGDLGARIRGGGPGEIAALAEALDALAANLSGTLAALRGERDLLDSILSGMREGVLVLDSVGRVVLVNPALREMLLLPADATGRTVLELVRHAELKALLERARREGEAPPPPSEIELAGIKPRRLLVHASALRGERGRIGQSAVRAEGAVHGDAAKPSGLLAVFVDVTDLRRLEMLRRDFVANASHELRTPVATVRSAAETLRAALGDPEAARTFVEIIERNAERLHRLVEDLLDLSRIEAREYRLKLEPLELRPAVESLLAAQRERAERRRLRLAIAIPPELPRARADRRALDQVLGNLLDNALKYAADGAAVTVRARDDGAGAVCISVEDTGPGIERRHLSRLFERFYRVDAGRSRELGGTGLGLSIVKHLVEAMGGSISVESEPGRGSAFHVTLPRA
jgi:two-component system phosphate regulon sensor histidine kinase PhoR